MSFVLNKDTKAVNFITNEEESDAVKIAFENLKKDLNMSFGIKEDEKAELTISAKTVDDPSFAWEEYRIEAKGKALYIKGGDRRGTIYGIYTLSKMCGVSPWHYMADVPVHAPGQVSFEEGEVIKDAPTVQYRGIFINDEEELDKWARLHMDEPTIGVNTYKHVFELILRLKGNYIWPAMHVNSFNMYPECGALAEKMGVVVGTSHCDMLMRSNFREWEPWIKSKGYTDAVYDYSFEGKNRDILKEYWRESVEQNKNFELSYTLGMRGIHDSGFDTKALKASSEEELMDKKCKLLEQVINDQEDILKNTLGRDTLKIFVPYKEVLNLYDRGLKVPEDITLIWTNDNYGYVRRYPSKKEQKRKGGNGIYYHCSYWAPTLRHYLFLSSHPIAKIRYEMGKAYDNGIQKLWVCNMGAIKPLEQEMEYFITLGWDYGKENATVDDPEVYLTNWVRENFPGLDAKEAARLLNIYARVSDLRKVEFMEEDVFSQGESGNEAAIRFNTLKQVYDGLTKMYETLEGQDKEAFFELILMKVHAAYLTTGMYYFADRSNIKAKEGKPGLANKYTRLTKAFEDERRKMLYYYNKEMCEGKWDGILTPEDFPPPRTGMHPASVPGLSDNALEEADANVARTPYAKGYRAIDAKLTNCNIIKGLGHATEELVEVGNVEFNFETFKTGKLIIEIDRYPSLNSVGEIYTHVSLDDKSKEKLLTEANDEWRGSWLENITDGVDRMYITYDAVKAGNHKLVLSDASRYFAVSKIVVYEGELIKNRLGCLEAFTGDFSGEDLPGEDSLEKAFYSGINVGEKTIPVGRFVDGVNVMNLTDDTEYKGKERELFMPDRLLTAKEILNFKNTVPSEKDGAVIIEAASELDNENFEYCTGVTYKRTNLSLYIRERGLSFKENPLRLNFDFECDGGDYVIYALMKCDSRHDAKVGLFIDDKKIKTAWEEDLPWRYEAEKIYRYVPLTKASLKTGKHKVSLEIYASCVRLERIILKK